MKLIILLPFVLLLNACGDSNRFEMTKDGKGRTVRLDKRTGEIAVIENDRIVLLKEQKGTENASEEMGVEQPKFWPPIDVSQLGGLKATIVTSCQENRLAYQFRIEPASERLEQAKKKGLFPPELTVDLHDGHGFKIITIHLPLHNLEQLVDKNGKGVALLANDSVSLSCNSYSKASTWNLGWNL